MMTAEERAKVLGWLEESHQEFLTAIEGAPQEVWRWKASPEGWSVRDIAEHVVKAEALLFRAVQRALAQPANPGWAEQTKGKTELIERVMAPRLGRAKAPETLAPKSATAAAEVRAAFENQRAGIASFVLESVAPVHQHTVDHPFPFFGTLSAYQWLIYIPLHTMRHDKQIAEVKASPGYPG